MRLPPSRLLLALALTLLAPLAAHAQEYGVRAGDRITIDFYTANGASVPEIVGERTVDREGNLFLPLVGTVSVEGLDAVGIRVKLEDLYADLYPDAVIEVDALLRVSVTGMVQQPGTFYMDPSTTAVQAIAEAGGGRFQVQSAGSARPPNLGAVRLVRDGEVQELDLQAEDPSRDALAIRIQSGDWFYVPAISSARSLRENVSFWGQLASLALTIVILVDQLGGG